MKELSTELTYKVSSQEEYTKFLNFIASKAFKYDKGYAVTPDWKHVQFRNEKFQLISNSAIKYPVIDCKDVIGFKEFIGELTSLPEKWKLKITQDNISFINSVRDRTVSSHCYIVSNLCESNKPNSWYATSAPSEEFIEITLDQFKKWVLSDKSVSPIIKEIQAECKKRFPIGCTFKFPEGSEYVLKQDEFTYKIVENHIYAGEGQGLLYNGQNKRYATLIEEPKPLFKVGDRVKAIDESDGWGDVEYGDIGVVKHVYSGKLSVDFPKHAGWLGTFACFEFVRHEPVKEPVSKPLTEEEFDALFEEEFKVGDWAVITSLQSKSQGILTGKIGHVFQIDNIEDEWHRCTQETYCIGSSWPADCLRKATQEEIAKALKVFPATSTKTEYPLSPSECYKSDKPVDVLYKYQQTPVIYSGKKVKRKLVTIFN